MGDAGAALGLGDARHAIGCALPKADNGAGWLGPFPDSGGDAPAIAASDGSLKHDSEEAKRAIPRGIAPELCDRFLAQRPTRGY